MNRFLKGFVLVSASMGAATIMASDGAVEPPIAEPVPAEIGAGFFNRLQPYGLNYAIYEGSWLHDQADGKTKVDEPAVEVHYSFKYTYFDCNVGNESNKAENLAILAENEKRKLEHEKQKEAARLQKLLNPALDDIVVDKLALLAKKELTDAFTCAYDSDVKFSSFLSYTGEFDFYVNPMGIGRESGPVINRISNIALHGEWRYTGRTINFLDVGLEHRSDGQVTEIDEVDGNGDLKTQQEYSAGNDEYFDGLSRGSDYISLTVGDIVRDKPSWSVSTKFYGGKETDVNWGKLAGKHVSISDYDILRLFYSHTFHTNGSSFKKVTASTEYTVGEGGLNKDSIDVNLIFPYQPEATKGNWDIPLMLRLHHGPMEKLADYTNNITSFGIGLAFNY